MPFSELQENTIQDIVKSIQEKIILDSTRLADTYVPRELKWDSAANILETLSNHGIKLLPYYTQTDQIEPLSLQNAHEIVNEESDVKHDTWYIVKDELSSHSIVQLTSWLGGLLIQEIEEGKQSEEYDGTSEWKLIGLFTTLPGFTLGDEWKRTIDEAYRKWEESNNDDDPNQDKDESDNDYWGKYDEISDDEKIEENKRTESKQTNNNDEEAYYAMYDKVDEDDTSDKEQEHFQARNSAQDLLDTLPTISHPPISEPSEQLISSAIQQLYLHCQTTEHITKEQFVSTVSKLLKDL